MYVEDRVLQAPESKRQSFIHEKSHQHSFIEEKFKNPEISNDPTIENIDKEIKKIEDSILKTEQDNTNIKQRVRHFSGSKHKSRNNMTESRTVTTNQLNTQRNSRINTYRSFIADNEDLDSQTLIDIRTKPKVAERIASRQNTNSKKRPQSSRLKRAQITNKALHKPVIEGEIMMRISVKIQGNATIIANVYKGDTAYSVADRCIAQQLDKMKVAQPSNI